MKKLLISLAIFGALLLGGCLDPPRQIVGVIKSIDYKFTYVGPDVTVVTMQDGRKFVFQNIVSGLSEGKPYRIEYWPGSYGYLKIKSFAPQGG